MIAGAQPLLRPTLQAARLCLGRGVKGHGGRRVRARGSTKTIGAPWLAPSCGQGGAAWQWRCKVTPTPPPRRPAGAMPRASEGAPRSRSAHQKLSFLTSSPAGGMRASSPGAGVPPSFAGTGGGRQPLRYARFRKEDRGRSPHNKEFRSPPPPPPRAAATQPCLGNDCEGSS